MARSGMVVMRFSKAAGELPSTETRRLRSLRAEKMAPTGTPGREGQEGHYEAPHLASHLLGFATENPGETAAWAASLGSMRRAVTNEEGIIVSKYGPTTLAEDLVEMLNRAAEWRRAKSRGEDPGLHLPIPSAILFSLHLPRKAEVYWLPFRKSHDTYFPEGSYSSGSISRAFTLHRPIIDLAIDLLVDTLNQQDRASTTIPKRKTPETEGASNTPAPAPTRTSNDRSRTRETGRLPSPKVKRVCAASQALAAPRIGHSSLSTGDDRHDVENPRGPPPPC